MQPIMQAYSQNLHQRRRSTSVVHVDVSSKRELVAAVRALDRETPALIRLSRTDGGVSFFRFDFTDARSPRAPRRALSDDAFLKRLDRIAAAINRLPKECF